MFGVLALMGALTVTNANASDRPTTSSAPATSGTSTSTNVKASAQDTSTPYPLGVPDSSEPSGYAPPSSSALPGYELTYTNDFTGTTLPSGWDAFNGTPSGDPGAQWSSSQVVVSNGMLQLNTSQDPADNDEWVSGGLCQCGDPQTYGAFFVRSKMTGIGPTQVELLWPVAGWPPEVDFDETYGGDTMSMATLHYTSANLEVQNTINIDVTQWHTWGVIWSADSIIFTVDGNEWATINSPSEIPDQAMTLDIQQQTFCEAGWACPTTPESTDVDWAAEYSASTSTSPPTTSTVVSEPPPPPPPPVSPPITTTTNPPTTTTVVHRSNADSITLSPFATNSASLSPTLNARIARLASEIVANSDTEVTLTGYSSELGNRKEALAIAKTRAVRVEEYLRLRLDELGATRVTIIARKALSSDESVTANVKSRSVIALIR
jgi:beta-glucanase (GH16 family)